VKQGCYVDEIGTMRHYRDGKKHSCDDEPALISAEGDMHWYKDDQLHRDNDLPAIIYASGTKQWMKDGELYRLAGPAIEYAHGPKEYWINDKELTKEEHANHPLVKKYKLQQVLNRILKE
jgi:hypothetical protein